MLVVKGTYYMVYENIPTHVRMITVPPQKGDYKFWIHMHRQDHD